MHPKQLAYQAVPGWSFASRFCWNAAACNGQRERVCTDPVTSLRISSAKSSGSGSSPRATIKPRASSWPPACSPKVLNLQSGPMVRDGSNPGIRGGTEAGGASRAEGARSSGDTTPTTARSEVAPKQQQQHILESDSTGGGHRAGTGIPGKSEFSVHWSDDKIINQIEAVANDPSSSRTPGRNGVAIVRGSRDGIDMIVSKDGSIVTGYPTNVPRNPSR